MNFKEKLASLNELLNDFKEIYKKNRSIINLMILVLIGGFFILILKLWAYYVTESMVLKSDALESLINLLAGSFALFSIFFSNRPADRNHPYGHGKIESFSAFFEGGLIILASVLIMYESIEKFFVGIEIKKINMGILINFIAGSINGIMGFLLVKKGKQSNSQSLIADGQHLLSDFYTTLGIFLSLILVHITNKLWLDPLIAFVFGIWLLITGFKILLRSTDQLLDTENKQIVEKIIDSINHINEERVITVHAMRVIQSGNFFHIDIHLVLPEYFTIDEANTLIHQFEIKVLKHAKINGEFHSHIDPCKRMFCKICKIQNCSIRAENFIENQILTYQIATSWPKDDKDRIVIFH